jgi:hypothetical protein
MRVFRSVLPSLLLFAIPSLAGAELRLLTPGEVVRNGKETVVCTSGSDKKVTVKCTCEKQDSFIGTIKFDVSEQLDPAVASRSDLVEEVVTAICRSKFGWTSGGAKNCGQ